MTESHTVLLMCWKSSNVGGCDPVRWRPFLLLKQCDVRGGDSGQEEQEAVQEQAAPPPTQRCSDADRFDVVFSDVVMPGMNGIDLAHHIRRDHHDLPVLLASGYSHVLAQNGTYGFELLHKPYSIEQLSCLLRKVATWQRRKRIMGK